MADEDSHSQRLVPEINSPKIQNQANPSKLNFSFIYKAVLVSIILVILPLFPSQAPEFVNQTIPDRSWELVHLLFVGIAVSYGLFSRINVEVERENQLKTENTQTYMSRILQVSSVFDDDFETPSGSDENLVQTWNSRYLRGESTVLVAEENSVLDEQINHRRNVSIKPLLLPVRSLRSQISDPHFVESVKEEESIDSSVNMYAESTDRNDNGEIEDLGSLDLDEKMKGNFVLPSPIPWRSRSGRMVISEQVNSFPSSIKESEFNELNFESVPSPIYFPSRPNPISPSTKFTSISPEFQSENVKKTENDNISKSFSLPIQSQSVYNTHKSSLVTSNSSPSIDEFLAEKETKRSFKDQKDLRRRSRENVELHFSKSEAIHQSSSNMSNSNPITDVFSVDKDIKRSLKNPKDLRRRSREDFGLDFVKAETKCSENSSSITLDSTPNENGYAVEKDIIKSFKNPDNFSPRSIEGDLGLNFSKSESKSRTRNGGLSKGKSVRTVRASEPVLESNKKKERNEYQLDGKIVDKTRKRSEGFDSLSLSNGKSSYESSQPSPTFSKHQKKYKKKLSEKVILESEEYSGSEIDEVQRSSDKKEETVLLDTTSYSNSDSNEVDKKADEFIAKFREQIRLQKVETSKRSNGKHSSRNLSR